MVMLIVDSNGNHEEELDDILVNTSESGSIRHVLQEVNVARGFGVYTMARHENFDVPPQLEL